MSLGYSTCFFYHKSSNTDLYRLNKRICGDPFKPIIKELEVPRVQHMFLLSQVFKLQLGLFPSLRQNSQFKFLTTQIISIELFKPIEQFDPLESLTHLNRLNHCNEMYNLNHTIHANLHLAYNQFRPFEFWNHLHTIKLFEPF